MLLSANEVSAELLTVRGGGDDAAPSNHPHPAPLPLLPQEGWGERGHVVAGVETLSQLFFRLCEEL